MPHKDKEKRNEYHKQYYQKTKEKQLMRAKEYRENNKEKIKQYRNTGS